MLGIHNAEHAEDTPGATNPLIVAVACAWPAGQAGAPRLNGALRVRLTPGSRVFAIHGRAEVDEVHFCGYEANPAFRAALEAGGLRTSGVGPADEVRVVELPDHPFFVGTLYQPQRSSRPGAPHPLVTAFVRAAADRPPRASRPIGNAPAI